MPLFHETLNDALHKLNKNDHAGCLEIMKKHEEVELKEQSYIESSLYSIRVYLKNYISHIYMTIELLSNNKKLSDEDKKKVIENIEKCKKNILGFEDASKELLKREGALLE